MEAITENKLHDKGEKKSDYQCLYIKDDGERCGGYGSEESDYCWFHDPDREEERSIAGRRGGKHKPRRKSKMPKAIDTIDDAADVLKDVIKRAYMRPSNVANDRIILTATKQLVAILSPKETQKAMEELRELREELEVDND